MKDNEKGFLKASRRNFIKAGLAGSAALVMAQVETLARSKTKILPSAVIATSIQPPTPAWAKDLILYELEVKGFTSPKGPETGTFETLRQKLPYLQDLGITGLWTGVPWLSDAHHYYNGMWEHYAVTEPDKFDTSLGSEQDFKRFVDESHQRGIRIFLDIRTSGVLPTSPLLKTHPEWFRGVSWTLPDFDWYGGHTDLDDWWVNIWNDYVKKFKVDGFRLDVNLFRPDLWERVRQYAASIGHPIVLFEEGNAALPGVTDFIQKEYEMPIEVLEKDVPAFYDRKYGTGGPYRVIIQYGDDGSRFEGSTNGEGVLRVRLDGLKEDRVSRRKGYPHDGNGIDTDPDGVPDLQLTVENVAARPIENITVRSDMGYMDGNWQYVPYHFIMSDTVRPLTYEGKPPTLKIHVATLQNGWPSIQLSSHDDGNDGTWPEKGSPYTAQGSRSLFGYSVMLTPAIPLFYSGEEFDATFRPMPTQSADLVAGGNPGKGRMLYGCRLDWDELNQPRQRAMFEDVKRMIAIRKREKEILEVRPEPIRPQLMAVPFDSEVKVPKPYIRWNERAAIVVAANRNSGQDANLTLRVPLQEIGFSGHSSYRVTDLWAEEEAHMYSESDLAHLACMVKRDKSPRGGLRVLKIEPVS